MDYLKEEVRDVELFFFNPFFAKILREGVKKKFSCGQTGGGTHCSKLSKKKLVIKNILSKTYVLHHSGSFDKHIGKRKKNILWLCLQKPAFAVQGGGLRTLRTCPQLLGVFS